MQCSEDRRPAPSDGAGLPRPAKGFDGLPDAVRSHHPAGTANASAVHLRDRHTEPRQTRRPPDGTVPPGTRTPSLAAGQYTTPVVFGGSTYQVLVRIPDRAPGARLPMVLDLHGSRSTGPDQLAYSNMAPTADANGFVVVAPTGVVPSGSGFSWNVPHVTPSGTRDDVGFIRQVIDTLTVGACLDPARIYATGYSGGGRMASALGCMLSDRIAAIAPVAGLRAGRPDPSGASAPDPASCAPSRPVPVIAFHGQRDGTNPYGGGGDVIAWRYSVPVALQRWAALNDCTTGPTTTRISAHVRKTVFTGCRAGAEAQLYTVSDGGHTWPGTPHDNGNGLVTREIDANRLMWEFFRRHTLP
ncbi:alpha/beta hydrolase family esterase [Streptomyces sp. NPDC060194]|uniref:extracellular catalytic domain type 1 short-chain-length polyhydroxyalkanoate depolymerase n=1 Tax=Streptomyces sp. NPDC060194 TaxID=3347069 RepID=UPI00365C75EE